MGTTVLEVLAACTLLSAAIALSAQLQAQSRQAARAHEQASRIRWELSNLRQRISTWPRDQVDVRAIESLGLSPMVSESIDGAELKAAIQKLDKPARVLQVTLSIARQGAGQALTSSTLTFWIPSDEAALPGAGAAQ